MTGAEQRFDPRSKLAVALAFVLAGFLTGTIRGQLLFFALLGVVVLVLGEVSIRDWLGALKPLAVLVVLLLVLNTPFYASGPAWYAVQIGPVELAVTPGGAQTAGLIAARLVLVAGAAAWFALGTAPERFEAALVELGLPWSFAFLLSLTIGLVPEMRKRFRTIEESQRTRGLDLSGGPIARTRARLPMLVPFLAAVIRYGYDLSTALTARGFDEPGPRTSITTVDHTRRDLGLYLLAVGVVSVGLVL
ncbi:energy-coupling factor transporter transmembrane component T [Halodesulfurarchaeum sp. HSR-GB]|uniref:energy-coupling factor transporter transmembrane component T n=1 Tax=Halodesulfurarchaeum TaxID=1980514 RepID=UPI000903DA9A|nr:MULTISPECIES: energy-coupling factor transporter transmembrane component T [Halodesulfurarchaeum]MDR5656458.1 energy-coupling factor transporter transmembrane component T [Halodesulfurarchaeum sp. HSR-GB]